MALTPARGDIIPGLAVARRPLAVRLTAAGLLAAASLAGPPSAQAALVVYNYTGSTLSYAPRPPELPPFTTYGTRVLAQLTLDDAFVNTSFTGVLDSTQFLAEIGTDVGYPLIAAGTWRVPTSGQILSAFVSLQQGVIVDWSFGSVRNVLGNQITIGSTGQGDTILPFPRVVNWGTAGTSIAGTWAAVVNPVSEPATAWLLSATVAMWSLVAAGRQRG